MTRPKKMRVVLKEPGAAARVEMIPNDLKSLQAAVGGYVEAIALGELIALVNEDGKRLNLAANVVLPRYGLIVGPLLVVGQDPEDPGEFGSLSEDQAAAAVARFALHPPVYCEDPVT